VLDQGVDVTDAGKTVLIPRCVLEDFGTLKLKNGATVTIKQTTVKYQDTQKWYNFLSGAETPAVQGCASLYDSASSPDASSITFNTATGSEASGHCCRCQDGLQAYTLNDLKAVFFSDSSDLPAPAAGAKCNIVLCARRQYFDSDATTPVFKNCLTSEHTSFSKSSTCAFCEPGFAFNKNDGDTVTKCVEITALKTKQSKENYACLQSRNSNSCGVCAWPLISTRVGSTANPQPDAVCAWPAWNSIESTNSGQNNPFVAN